jgi:signal transduction histidine kinase
MSGLGEWPRGSNARCSCYTSRMMLDLRDRQALLDSMEAVLDYLPAKERKPFEDVYLAEREDEPVSHDRLLELSLQAGVETWPARQAFKQFVTSVGQELEWDLVTKHVSRPVAFFLLQRKTDEMGLDQVLQQEGIEHALYPEHRQEIELVRQEAHRLLYQDHKEMLEPVMHEMRSELDGIRQFLKRQKEEALARTGKEQEESLDALQQIEARLFLLGEWLPIEVIRDELPTA